MMRNVCRAALGLVMAVGCGDDGSSDGSGGGTGDGTGGTTSGPTSGGPTSGDDGGTLDGSGDESGGPPIDIPDFTGTYARTFDADGASCDGPALFRIVQHADELFVSDRSTTCEGKAGTAGVEVGPLQIAPDGTLYDRGRMAGTIAEDALQLVGTEWFAGCDDGRITLNLIRRPDGSFDYEDEGAGCGAGLQLAGEASLSPEPLLIPTEGVTQPHAVTVGATETFTVELSNVGPAAATELTATPSPAIAFAGGDYPGTGGTCSTELAAGTSCTLVIEATVDVPSVANGRIDLEYTGGQPDPWTLAVAVRLIAVSSLDGVNDLGVGQLLQHVCLLRGADVECVDFQPDAEFATQIPTFSNPTDIDVSSVYACVVDDDGLHCWGNSASDFLPGTGLQDLSEEYGLGCAHYGDAQGFVCLSQGSSSFDVIELDAPTDIAVGPDFLCLVDGGALKCTERETDVLVPIPPGVVGVVDVAAGSRWICARTDTAMTCFDADGALHIPDGLEAAQMMRQDGRLACADVAGDLRCWGHGTVERAGAGPITALDLADDMGCYVGSAGLDCFAPFDPFEPY